MTLLFAKTSMSERANKLLSLKQVSKKLQESIPDTLLQVVHNGYCDTSVIVKSEEELSNHKGYIYKLRRVLQLI